jgi:serine/threonine-protein kinase
MNPVAADLPGGSFFNASFRDISFASGEISMQFDDARKRKLNVLETEYAPSKAARRQGARLNDGRWTLVRPLGAGGMGDVWLANDANRGSDQPLVALKFLPHHQLLDQAAKTRFQKEFTAVSGLQSKYNCPVLDLQLDDPVFGPYLVMKYVEGENLADLLGRHGQMDPAAALVLLTQIAEGLDDLHEAGISHRDVKPENIMLERLPNKQSRVQIVDFGIAGKIIPTSSGAAPSSAASAVAEGTFRYMSPEQWNRGRPNARSDQYSFACVAYEMLAGYPVFDGGTEDELRSQHLSAEPRRIANVSESAFAVLKQGLAKRPLDRHANCREFVQQLRNALMGGGGPTSPSTKPTGGPKIAPPPPKPTGVKPPVIRGLRTTVRQAGATQNTSAGPVVASPVNPSPGPRPPNSGGFAVPNPYTAVPVPPPAQQLDVLAKTVSLKVWLWIQVASQICLWLSCFMLLVASGVAGSVNSRGDGAIMIGFMIIIAMAGAFFGAVAFLVSYLLFLGTAWAALPASQQTPVSSAILRMFIPFYGAYWLFRMQYVMLDELENCLAGSGVMKPKMPREMYWMMLVTLPIVPVHCLLQLLVHQQMLNAFRRLRQEYALPV